MAKKKRSRDGTRFICKCECGGNVRGARSLGRLWTFCDLCSPTTIIDVDKLRSAATISKKRK